MEASWGGERPMKVGSAAALKEAAECLPFGAIYMVSFFEKGWRKLEKLWVQKISRALFSDAGLIGRDEQPSELTVERPGSFIGSLMAEISDAYCELNLSKTRVQRGTRVKMMSVSRNIQHDLRVSSATESRILTPSEGHIPTMIEGHIPISIEGHVLTSTRAASSLKFTSEEDQHNSRASSNEGCVLSYIKSMPLLLQFVQ